VFENRWLILFLLTSPSGIDAPITGLEVGIEYLATVSRSCADISLST